MCKHPLFLCALALGPIAGTVHAQAETWTKQAPMPTGGSIMGVAALSHDDIWCTAPPASGDSAQVAHTTSGGLSWEVTKLGASGANAVFFLDDQHGWLAGNAFRHTVDGGQTWVKDNQWGSIYDLFFLDLQRGWACGNGAVAYYTTDGGLNWNAVTTPGASTLSSIWFVDALNGWTVDIGGRIMHSGDGGQSWTLVLDTGKYLSTIQFLTPQEGWAIGGNTFLHTLDGGQTWTPSVVPAKTWSHGARFFDAMHGVSVGDDILLTQDGGANWTTIQQAGSGAGLWDVEYGDAQTIVASGFGGALIRSSDGGLTWGPIQSGAWGITRGIDYYDAEIAWATNQGGEIVRTTNGGQLWERSRVAGNYDDLHDIDFVDTQAGWVVGEHGIAGSVDGGVTWTQQVDVGEYHGVLGFDPQTAVAFGGKMLRTTNGGQDWVDAGPPKGNYRGGCALGTQVGWVAGSHIYATTNAGASWTQQYQSPGQLAAISFADSQHGWASGFQELMVRTTDGGQTWVQQDVGAPAGAALMGVWAVSPTTAWVTGWYGFVARTTDGGTTWEEQPIPKTKQAYFECIEFLDAERGWVAGDQGIWFRGVGEDLGENYCGPANFNSTGMSAHISAFGSYSAAANHLTLTAIQIPPDQFGYFIAGETQGFQAFVGNSQGNLCLAGEIARMANQVGNSGAAGELSISVDLTQIPTSPPHSVVAGETWNFQAWFRDANPDPTSNFTEGISILFQ